VPEGRIELAEHRSSTDYRDYKAPLQPLGSGMVPTAELESATQAL